MAVLGERTILSMSLKRCHCFASSAGLFSVWAVRSVPLHHFGVEREGGRRTGLELEEGDGGEGEAEDGCEDELVLLVEVVPRCDCHGACLVEREGGGGEEVPASSLVVVVVGEVAARRASRPPRPRSGRSRSAHTR